MFVKNNLRKKFKNIEEAQISEILKTNKLKMIIKKKYSIVLTTVGDF